MAIYPVISAKSPAALIKSSATVVWLFLIVATGVSWTLGTDHVFVGSQSIASITILLVAFVKIRFIGLYFMELKDAPLVLRALLEAYCLIVCGTLIGFYLAA